MQAPLGARLCDPVLYVPLLMITHGFALSDLARRRSGVASALAGETTA
jgi:hypothetical protein